MSTTDAAPAILTDAHGTILEWPPALEELVGYSASEAIGRKVDLIVPPALRGRHWNGFDKAMSSGRLKRDGKPFTTVGAHKSGRLIPLRAVLELRRADDGAVIGAKGTILGRGPGWLAPAARVLLALPGIRTSA